MTLAFWALAALLTVIALLFLLPPLLRSRPAAADPREAANAEVYREQLAELKAELERGAIGDDEYASARREIERRVVSENAAGHAQAAAAPRRASRTAIAIAVLLPLVAGLGYWRLGNPDALQAEAMEQFAHSVTPQQMAGLVERLAERMQQTPDDAEGWMLLGRSRLVLGQYAKAADAYARAAKLLPEDARVLVDYADALAMAQDRSLEGEPLKLIQRALALDPDNIKGLALAGTAEFDRGRYDAAIGYWERLQAAAPPQSELANSTAESIAEARRRAGGSPVAAAQETKAGKQAAGGGSIEGVVRLEPALREKAAPGDTVFVLARPANGQRMPLAVQRVTVAQLPYRFRLDDSMAMAPGATISSHAQVVVVARISKSGTPAPQKGDIEGVSAAVAPGATGLEIVLSKIVP